MASEDLQRILAELATVVYDRASELLRGLYDDIEKAARRCLKTKKAGDVPAHPGSRVRLGLAGLLRSAPASVR